MNGIHSGFIGDTTICFLVAFAIGVIFRSAGNLTGDPENSKYCKAIGEFALLVSLGLYSLAILWTLGG